jgi:hypothetical protein
VPAAGGEAQRGGEQFPRQPGRATVMGMMEETRIALMNYDRLIRSQGLDDVSIDWVTDIVAYGNGGFTVEELCRPGFTDATTPEGLEASGRSDTPPWDGDGDPPF